MSGYRLSPRAAEELDAVLEHILQEGGPTAAEKVADEFSRCLRMLAERPGIGRVWEEAPGGTVRVWSLWSYLIFYDPGTRPIGIARIIHGARDIRHQSDAP
jgi:antitoxin ParD1/3/4/toxin ParE1/3/4